MGGEFEPRSWIGTKQSAGTPSIVDKRGRQPLGYPIFTYQGRPALQLADGSRGRGPFADLSIADGRWHHVAGLVQRLPPRPDAIFVDGLRRDVNRGNVNPSSRRARTESATPADGQSRRTSYTSSRSRKPSGFPLGM
jgi:hypothetical protein